MRLILAFLLVINLIPFAVVGVLCGIATSGWRCGWGLWADTVDWIHTWDHHD